MAFSRPNTIALYIYIYLCICVHRWRYVYVYTPARGRKICVLFALFLVFFRTVSHVGKLMTMMMLMMVCVLRVCVCVSIYVAEVCVYV